MLKVSCSEAFQGIEHRVQRCPDVSRGRPYIRGDHVTLVEIVEVQKEVRLIL